jgi:hypothetical protein
VEGTTAGVHASARVAGVEWPRTIVGPRCGRPGGMPVAAVF